MLLILNCSEPSKMHTENYENICCSQCICLLSFKFLLRCISFQISLETVMESNEDTSYWWPGGNQIGLRNPGFNSKFIFILGLLLCDIFTRCSLK